MNKNLIQWAAIFGFTAVGLGAFGAHGLKALLDERLLAVFDTGVRYQFYHCMAIFICAFLYEQHSTKYFRWAGRLFIAGIFLFSGSLYLLSCRFLLGLESWTFLGPITPIGGLCFMLGWALIFRGALDREFN